MAPNVYLHISLLQPHAQTVNDLPIRMYGIAPVFVTNRQTILQPQIKMPEVLRPETDFNVTVSEKSGKPMTYTLAIVDDGLLDLTNFKTPDPWNEFYAREALGIRTWDMYDDVLGASGGRYSSLFSTGGDASLKPADAKANRFKPVVKFIGPFYLAKGKQQTHTLKLPMYVGSVRAMVVAGQDGAYGNAEKTAFVRTPLMLLSTLPRVLSTQEEITVPVNVFAMENQVKNVTVSLEASGAGVQITGNRQQSLTFDQPGDQLAYFTLKTGSKTGKATIHLTASGNGQQTKETIEIEVRNPNPVVTLRNSQWIEAGQEAELSYTLAGSSSANNQVQLEVSRIPSVDISRRFDFLYNYQHHCTEQLTSKALPLLFVSQFKAVDEQEAEKIKTNVQEAIRHICPPASQRRICILAGQRRRRRMDHFLHGYVPDTGTRKRVCRSSERTEQMETLPACRRPKLAYAAGSKQLADMAIGIAAGLPPLYPCTGRCTGIRSHEPHEGTAGTLHPSQMETGSRLRADR